MASIQNIVMIGAGNVGTHLARALHHQGFQIKQVFSRDFSKSRVLAESVGAEAIDDLTRILPAADLYILAVKDDALQELSQKLRLTGIVVHTSGTASIDVIKPVSGRAGVFYPLQTFTKERALEWKELPICIEASDEETGNALTELASHLTKRVCSLSSDDRRWLHLAAVFVNNFCNHLLLEAQMVTESRGIPFDILRPLAVETVLKAFELGPLKAQTGPAKRGDEATMNMQEQMLPDENMKIVYRLLSRSIREQK